MKLVKILCLLLCLALLSGCGPANTPADTPYDSTGSAESTGTGESTGATESSGAADDSDSLKILTIGGSFSIDAMEYLYQIAQDGGVKKIVLGNLYNGGASLGRHVNFATSDAPNYTYYKNTTGTWETTDNYKISQALEDEDWDYITMQQSSGSSGMDYTYEDALPKLIQYVRERNTSAKLVWHMTWAYQSDYREGAFSVYGNDQMKMYNMILDCIKDYVLTEDQISFVIPAGTAIQNARTSFIGDTLTRDGFHLDMEIGRYIAGLTWYAAITGSPVDNITYNPSPEKISDEMLAVAREAATNAVANPYEVTQSAFTEGTRP